MSSVTAQDQLMPGYLDLKSLAVYSSCSVRWLRDRLTDSAVPLPFYRVGGKILVSKADFDAWMASFRIMHEPIGVKTLVDEVLADIFPNKPIDGKRSH
ncbi:MAG: hypothetical protein QM771_05940 [Nitrospira sp.]